MKAITNKIIDIHNHSLPGIDDGAKDIEEAVSNIKYLTSLGITDIVLTSHYILNSKYQTPVLDRLTSLKELKKATKDLNVNLYLGNEVFINDSKTLIDLLNTNQITTLNNSKYLLIEFPRHQYINHLDNLICELNDIGIIPIIAHPERYKMFQDDFTKLQELLEYNCLLQCNIMSIKGLYGKSAKKLFKKLIKSNMVSILATDFHHQRGKNLTKSLKKLYKLITPELLTQLLETNPKKVIENKNL